MGYYDERILHRHEVSPVSAVVGRDPYADPTKSGWKTVWYWIAWSIRSVNSAIPSWISVFKNTDQLCLLIAFFESLQCFPEGGVSERISIFQKTEKRNRPQHRPQKRTASCFWKTHFHLQMSFPEISEQIYFFIRVASDQFLCCICTKDSILQDPG